MDSKPCFKRVKERSVWQAKESVDQWRKLFKEGIRDSAGNTIKLTLKQAAEKVGIPKKTLEDYHQLLRKIEQFQSLEELKDKKMGYLRQLLKDKKIEQDHGMQEEEEYAAPQQMEEEEDMHDYQMPEQFTYEEQPTPTQNIQCEPNIDGWEDMILSGDVHHYQPDWEDDYPRRSDRRDMYEQSYMDQTQNVAGCDQYRNFQIVNTLHIITYANPARDDFVETATEIDLQSSDEEE